MAQTIPTINLAIGGYFQLFYPNPAVSESVLQAVALKFSDLAGFDIASSESEWTVTISAFDKSTLSVEDIARHYSNEVIDQQLREKIALQTQTERNLILSYAFSNTKLIQSV